MLADFAEIIDKGTASDLAIQISRWMRRDPRSCAVVMDAVAQFMEKRPDEVEDLYRVFIETPYGYDGKQTDRCCGALTRAMEARKGAFGKTFDREVGGKIRATTLARR